MANRKHGGFTVSHVKPALSNRCITDSRKSFLRDSCSHPSDTTTPTVSPFFFPTTIPRDNGKWSLFIIIMIYFFGKNGLYQFTNLEIVFTIYLIKPHSTSTIFSDCEYGRRSWLSVIITYAHHHRQVTSHHDWTPKIPWKTVLFDPAQKVQTLQKCLQCLNAT